MRKWFYGRLPNIGGGGGGWLLGLSVVMVILLIILSGCGADELPRTSVVIGADEYGDDWAFTVDEVRLGCDGGMIYAQARTADGWAHYAMTGMGRSHWKDVSAFRDELWLDAPEGSLSPKIPLGRFIDRARGMCRV